MSNSTNASSISTNPIKQKQTQPLQLLLYIKFDAPTSEINNGDRTYSVTSLGCNTDFSEHAEHWFNEHPFDGKKEYRELTIREKDIETLRSQLFVKIKNIIVGLVSPLISKMEIIIFVPFNSVFSFYFSAVKFLLNIADEYSPLIKDFLCRSFGNPLDFSKFGKISIQSIYPLSLEIIENVQTDSSESNNQPTDIDARVAAVLCEYTYYLSRSQEQAEIEEPAEIKKQAAIKNIESKDNGKERKKKGRKGSIWDRREATKKEIDGLKIIPDSWKGIFDKEYGWTKDEYNQEFWNHINDVVASPPQQYNENDLSTLEELDERFGKGYMKLDWSEDSEMAAFRNELKNWDCINPEMNGWIGMRDGMRELSQDERKKAWENSDSKCIVDILRQTKDNGKLLYDKFSRNENKGVLNSWLGICRFSGLGSAIFINEERKVIMYCTAGSDFGNDLLINGDWMTTNFLQFFTGLSPQYQQSVTNAKILDEVVTKLNKGYKLFFIGHSLGGGLASNNAIVTKDRHAITFNAAGLNWMRVPISVMINKKSELAHPIRRRERVHLFVIKGELLDTVQGTVTPLPWKLNSLLYNALPYQTKGYCSTSTRREIETKLNEGLTGKHSMTNFLVPPKQILEIRI